VVEVDSPARVAEAIEAREALRTRLFSKPPTLEAPQIVPRRTSTQNQVE
jgi:hypothetical protein